MTPAAALQEWLRDVTLEEMMVSPHFFGLTTASPLQRATCRVLDGQPLGELAELPEVRDAMGDVSALHGRPREFVCVSGIRTFKSLLSAGAAILWSQRCDVSRLGPGEIPRIPILSLDKDKAMAITNHLVGRISASPVLRTLLLEDPTGDSVLLRHPTGRPVEVKVVAGKRSGSAVVAYWLAGFIADEFPRMNGSDDSVVNWDDTRNAADGRLLEGGQMFHVGSPWAPFGPAYDVVTKLHGHPTNKMVVLVAPAWDMNPTWWTPERVEDARVNNANFRTDVEAKFASPEENLFPAEQVDASTRTAPLALPYDPAASYAAFIDPATRGNAFTLVIVTRQARKMVVAAAYEWIGSKGAPLDTGIVLSDIAAICERYGVTHAATDQYMGDALESQARERAFALHQWHLNEAEKLQRALKFRTKLGIHEIELCPATTWRAGVTTTTSTLAIDVKRIQRVVTQTTAVVRLPLTSDGRHCDFWPPLMMAMGAYLDDVKTPDNNARAEVERMIKQAERRYGAQGDDDDG